jgi:hypothetical protein
MTLAEWNSKYRDKQAVILTNLDENFKKLAGIFTSDESIEKAFPQANVSSRQVFGTAGDWVSIHEYLQQSHQPQLDAWLYSKDTDIWKHGLRGQYAVPALLRVRFSDLLAVCLHVCASLRYAPPLVVQEYTVEDLLYLSSIVDGGSLSHSPAWVAMVTGRKQWHIKAAGKGWVSPMRCDPSGDGAEQPDDADVVECVQSPGEVIYIPDEWSQQSCNLQQFTAAVGGRCIWGECLGGRASEPSWSESTGPVLWAAMHGLSEYSAATQNSKLSWAPWQPTPLHWAAKQGDLELARHLIDKEAIDVNVSRAPLSV